MKAFSNTTGFITGGASGIGLAMARELGRRGMQVMLADIEARVLDSSVETLRSEGIEAHGTVLDVGDPDAYARVAEETLTTLGKVNFLFNNAGVGTLSPAGQTPIRDWQWVVNVNLLGVAYGVEYFLPSMQALDEPCHVMNTASLAGHVANAGFGPYNATKFAVVGYSESLRQELAQSNIGVSVLCPAWIKTRIAESGRNHPDARRAADAQSGMNPIAELIEAEGLPVDTLIQRAIDAMAEGTFYVFTHPDFRPMVEERLERVRADYNKLP
ncbi:SDR family NAD(P)-dependent oxidoreductase [Pseudohaliea rubra]|uniref:Short-chain dehydrogenase/reductase SDR n=1 Tax=Pseudohaliea rubra DSM 19751 TaxID=1265313 RepID=A0A095VN02_9GAMM|nr:SDR family NAD(P)-dependent oxidoreductase [Pseudohaliea rubra]KGE02750.1 Short-chain dehydrogenase/reductase SDR [Pseudohaliea rubra DSM 19751]